MLESDCQGPGDRDALLHATGELPGPVLGEVRQLNHLQQLHGAGLALGLVPSLQLQREFHVAPDGAPLEQRRLLEGHAVELLLPRLVRGHTGDLHLTLGGLREVGDDAQQRGLAAAGRSDQGDELPGVDREVDVLQSRGLIGLAGVEDLPHAICRYRVLGGRVRHALLSLGRLRVR